MLIDFHTHAFPDKIASGTINILKNNIIKQGFNVEPETDGTINGLIASMNKNNIDISVVLPIATNEKQTTNINNFAEKIRDNRIISFGSIYPEQTDYKEILNELKERGFKGIKLHPDYQDFYVDSEKCVNILTECERAGLYTIFHSGIDIGSPKPVHCTPQRLKNVLEYVSGKYIIAAHLGGWKMWDDVEKYLVGSQIYFDTAFIADYISEEQCKRIIHSHGADKILFASDNPWSSPVKEFKLIKSLDLSYEDEQKIFNKNALKILDI